MKSSTWKYNLFLPTDIEFYIYYIYIFYIYIHMLKIKKKSANIWEYNIGNNANIANFVHL